MQTRSELLQSKFSPLHFGTSGVRAKVTEMNDMECYINTCGFIKYLLKTNEMKIGDGIAIGCDLRKSSPRILSAVHKAILDEKCQTIYCGFVPTPTLSLYAWKRCMPAIMVTGSHIPDELNGIKFIKSKGEVLKSDEKAILENVAIARQDEYQKDENDSLFDEGGNFKNPIDLPSVKEEETALAEFKERYIGIFPADILKNKKIVLYEQSSVGRDLLKDILLALGAEIISVERSTNFIPIDTEKIPDFVTLSLKKWAYDFKPFAIVSLDGDADRPLLADENGAFFPGDLLGLLVSLYLKPDFVAIPISSNDAAVSALKELKVEVALTKIGSPYCIDTMNKKLAENPTAKVVSWERNGGYLLGSDWTINNKVLKSLPTRDSILPILIALLHATESNMSISELINSKIPHRYIASNAIDNKTKGCELYNASVGKIIIESFSPKDTDTKQLDFSSSDINQEAKDIKTTLESYFNQDLGYSEIMSINYTDGIRICFSNGDVAHLRPSSNAPEFRLYATADTLKRAESIVSDRLIVLPRIISDILQKT
ncbi:MAG: phosphomannomutase [bacterium]|nr:phosphomannomutase [bacterium]